MNRPVYFCWLVSLIVIHTLDMELTRNYIGDNWENESFPLMRYCIYAFGISTALWISRVIMYFYFYLCLIYQESKRWQYGLVIITTLYWTAMYSWLFTLDVADWNVVVEHMRNWIPLHR